MTPEEINREVAKRMGWYEEMLPSYISPWTGKECGLRPVLRNPETGNTSDIPNYCQDIGAAFEILNSLKHWEIKHEGSSNIVYVFSRPVKDGSVQIDNCSGVAGVSIPMAICLAFLKLP